MTVFFVHPENDLPPILEVKIFVWDDASQTSPPTEQVQWPEDGSVELAIPGSDYVRIWARIDSPCLIQVSSQTDCLAARAAYFIALESRGSVALAEGGSYESPEQLQSQLGEKFRIDDAYVRVRLWRRRLPAFFEQHLAFLGERVLNELTDVCMRDRGRSLQGRCTHPQVPLPSWVGKGYEGYSAYANDPNVPDNLFACLLVGYMTQEWAFVLWNRLGRRFWFASPVFALYQEANAARTAHELKEAMQMWDQGNESVLFMAGSGRLSPLQDIPGDNQDHA